MSVFKQHQSVAEPEFNCPSRIGQQGNPGDGIVLDGWEKCGEDRCCSYCGSLHPDDFIAIVDAYGRGEPGYKFDPSTKSYKRYARRPGVENASQGGIKFYMWHAPEAPSEEHKVSYAAAFKRYQDEFAQHFGAQASPAS